MSFTNINNVCSIGNHCITALLLKKGNIRSESYPFDWINSNIDVVKHCLEDNFKIFLDKKYYDRGKTHDNYEQIQNHTYFHDKYNNDLIMFRHRDPLNNISDYQYYQRCVDRFKKILDNKNNKLFIYCGNIDKNNDKILNIEATFKKYTTNYRILFIKHSNIKDYIFESINNIDFLELAIEGMFKKNEYLISIIKSKYNFNISKANNDLEMKKLCKKIGKTTKIKKPSMVLLLKSPKHQPPKQLSKQLPKQLPPKQLPKQLPPKQLPPKQLPPKQLPPKQLPPKQLPSKQLPSKQLSPKQHQPKLSTNILHSLLMIKNRNK